VSTVTQSGTRSSGKLIGGVVLAIIGVLAIIIGIIYVAEPASSLPSFIPGHIAGSTGHHPLHAIAAFVVGVILLVVGGFTAFRKPGSASPAGN
jgi:hypothetical protein